jgi:hypothetical protein
LDKIINELWSPTENFIPSPTLRANLTDMSPTFKNLFARYEKVVGALVPDCEDIATYLTCFEMNKIDAIVTETCRGYNRFKEKDSFGSETETENAKTEMVNRWRQTAGFLAEDLTELVFAVHEYLCDSTSTQMTGEQILMDLKTFLCGSSVARETKSEADCQLLQERINVLPFTDRETYNKYRGKQIVFDSPEDFYSIQPADERKENRRMKEEENNTLNRPRPPSRSI